MRYKHSYATFLALDKLPIDIKSFIVSIALLLDDELLPQISGKRYICCCWKLSSEYTHDVSEETEQTYDMPTISKISIRRSNISIDMLSGRYTMSAYYSSHQIIQRYYNIHITLPIM